VLIITMASQPREFYFRHTPPLSLRRHWSDAAAAAQPRAARAISYTVTTPTTPDAGHDTTPFTSYATCRRPESRRQLSRPLYLAAFAAIRCFARFAGRFRSRPLEAAIAAAGRRRAVTVMAMPPRADARDTATLR